MPFVRTHRARKSNIVSLGVGLDKDRWQDAYPCRPPNPQLYYDALLRLVNLVLSYAILCPRAVLCVLVRPCVSSCSLVRSSVNKISVPQKTLEGEVQCRVGGGVNPSPREEGTPQPRWLVGFLIIKTCVFSL